MPKTTGMQRDKTVSSRALRALVLQAPPAVIAPLLGYKAEHAEKIAAEAGNTWQRYAAGTHTPLTGTRP